MIKALNTYTYSYIDLPLYNQFDDFSDSNGSSSWTNYTNETADDANTDMITNADLGLAEDHFSHPEV